MEKYQFDQTLMQTMEDSHIPFAVYQFIDKRVVTLVLSAGFRKLFEFDKKEDAYYVMDNDMYRATHPDDKARIADAAFRFATEGGSYEVVYRTKTRNKRRPAGDRMVYQRRDLFPDRLRDGQQCFNGFL